MRELYSEADRNGIEVFRRSIPASKGIAVPGAVCIDDGMTGAEERTIFAHELGHCVTGSFYTICDPPYIRKRMGNRADKWAIKKLVPKDELQNSLKSGSEVWEIAEKFNVTNEFILKAICWYQHGNLALEYFGFL